MVVYTAIELQSLPHEDVVVVVVLRNDIFPSQSMNHMSCPKVVHMHDSLYLHAPPIYKMNNIGLLALTLSSACSYTLHASAHRLDICNTMVCCHNLVGSTTKIVDNFGRQGRYI